MIGDFRWFYSYDQEGWYEASSREDAIAQGREYYGDRAEGDPDADLHICEATRMLLTDDGIFDADSVIDSFESCNEDAWGEDGPLFTPTPDQKLELEADLTRAFTAWRAKHGGWRAWCFGETRNEQTVKLRPTAPDDGNLT